MREQRWRKGKDSFQLPSNLINTGRYGVEVIEGVGSDTTASAFIREHHYSGSYPAAVHRVGLYRLSRGRTFDLVGVCVFGVPSQRASIPRWTGLEPSAGVVLSRFVLLDDVPFNGETWCLARAFAALKRDRPATKAVLSYSDPMPRERSDGSVIMPGHIGQIYQAFNGLYQGRSRARTYWFDENGRTFDNRSFSKIRNQEKGCDAAYQRLVATCGDRRTPRESWESYILRVKPAHFRRVRTQGNHVYTWPLIPPFTDLGRGRRTKRRRAARTELAAIMPSTDLPYPRSPDSVGA